MDAKYFAKYFFSNFKAVRTDGIDLRFEIGLLRSGILQIIHYIVTTDRRIGMIITDIKVRKLFEEGPMKAIVSVTFDGQLALHDIKVISVRERNFIVMPSRKNPDGTYRDIVHPINAEFRAAVEEAVIDAYHVQLVAAEHDSESIADNSTVIM